MYQLCDVAGMVMYQLCDAAGTDLDYGEDSGY